MRRLLLVVGVVLLLGSTACDAFGADVAATVEGHDIPVSHVTALAKDPVFNRNGGTVTDSVMDGPAARGALSALIQFQITADELSRRGAEVTSDDRQTVDQQYGQDLAAMKPAARKVLLDRLAQQVALDRVLHEIDPKSTRERHEIYDRTPSSHEVRCFESLVVPTTGTLQVEAALNAGGTIPDVVSKSLGGAQALLGSPSLCLSRSEIPASFPANVTSLIFDTKKGTTAAVQAQTSNSDVTVITHAVDDKVLGRDDPDVSQLLSSIKQLGISIWLPLVMVDADVKVDPRFGRGINSTSVVIAPVTPPATGARLLPNAANATP